MPGKCIKDSSRAHVGTCPPWSRVEGVASHRRVNRYCRIRKVARFLPGAVNNASVVNTFNTTPGIRKTTHARAHTHTPTSTKHPPEITTGEEWPAQSNIRLKVNQIDARRSAACTLLGVMVLSFRASFYCVMPPSVGGQRSTLLPLSLSPPTALNGLPFAVESSGLRLEPASSPALPRLPPKKEKNNQKRLNKAPALTAHQFQQPSALVRGGELPRVRPLPSSTGRRAPPPAQPPCFRDHQTRPQTCADKSRHTRSAH